MAQKTTTDGGESTTEHPAAGVETIVVNPDDVIETMRRNARDSEEQRTHSLRINPPFKGEVRATPHVTQDGNYYPPETSPKPIHLGSVAFLAGRNNQSRLSRISDEAFYPIRNDSRARFRDEYGAYNEHGEPRELTDEEESEWGEWRETELEVWESAVRRELCDEIVLEAMAPADGSDLDEALKSVGVGETVETSVEIRYESGE